MTETVQNVVIILNSLGFVSLFMLYLMERR
jgi:hypothetical protein